MRRWLENPLFSGSLSALLISMISLMPILMLPISLFAVTPIFITSFLGGPVAGTVALLVPIVIFSLSLLQDGVFIFPLGIVLLGGILIATAWLLRGGWKTVQCAGTLLLITIAGFTLFFFVYTLVNQDIAVEISQYIDEQEQTFVLSLENLKQEGKPLSPVVQRQVKAGIQQLFEQFRRMAPVIPALLVLLWYGIYLLNLVAGRSYLIRIDAWNIQEASFIQRFQTPFHWIWPLIITGIFSLLFGIQQGFGYFAFNLMWLLMIPYLLQGIAIVLFMTQKMRLPQLWKTLFFLLMIFSGDIAIPMTALVGIFDTWLNLRTKFPEQNNSEMI
ncbi:DUF2232 domain-containing protein [Magnetococcales bacterium HHB-1]